MEKEKSVNNLNLYLNKVRFLLPYSESLTKETLEELRIDVQSALEDSPNESLNKSFGDPFEVAKNICESQNWHKYRASWWTRIFAWFIDLIIKYFTIGGLTIIFFLFVIIIIPYDNLLAEFSKWKNESFEINFISIFFIVSVSIVAIIAFSFMVIYNIVLEGRYNTTIGKKIFGLMVVDQTGCKITWKQAIIRNLTKIVTLDFVPAIVVLDTIIGMIIEKIDPNKINKQRGFDLIAETIVIKQPTNGGS